MKSSPSIWRYVVNVKSMVKILSILVAFLEKMNFMMIQKVRLFKIETIFDRDLGLERG